MGKKVKKVKRCNKMWLAAGLCPDPLGEVMRLATMGAYF